MESKLPAPHFSPEQSPTPYGQNIERSVDVLGPNVNLERKIEQIERQGEVSDSQSLADESSRLAVLPTIPVSVPDPVDDRQAVDDSPIVANDDDLIEKEWVDKAKKIISQTKDDPFRREYEVGKLQADYLRKRYGKEIGAA